MTAIRQTGRRRAVNFFYAGCAALLPALLFLPYLSSIHQLDPDAMSIVAHARATLLFHGWPMGFALLTMAMRPVNALINFSGLAWNDFLLAYRLVIYLSAIGIGVCTYGAIVLLVRNRPVALAVAMLVITLPGVTRLAVVAEDNFFSSFAQMLYLAVYLLYARAHLRRSRKEQLLYYAVPFALVFAVLSHREMNVLWATPAALIFFSRERPLAALPRIVLLYGVAITAFLVAYVGLTVIWDGSWTAGQYEKYVLDWFYPTEYYRNFYFWKRHGWRLGFQLGEIRKGIAGLVEFGPVLRQPFSRIYLAGLLVLAAPFVLRRRTPFRRIQFIPLLFALLHVPHAMIYESENLERWDAVAAPLAVFAATLVIHLHRSLHRRRTPLRGPRLSPMLLILPLLALILYGNLRFRLEAVQAMREVEARPENVVLTRLLRSNSQPERARDGRRRIVLLTREEYFPNTMLSSVYFAWSRDIFIIGPAGDISRPAFLFPTSGPFRGLTRDELLEHIGDAEVVATVRGHAWLRRLRREAAP